MNPQTTPDPSGRYAHYMRQWNRYTAAHGALTTAQARMEQTQTLKRIHRAHRHEMSVQAGGAPRWWPFTTRRQRQARYAVQRAMDAVDAAMEETEKLSEHIKTLTVQRDQAHRSATEARAEWEAECAARERFEAGDEPRGRTEFELFAEFGAQDERGRRGPQGRRRHEALNRWHQGEPTRTDEENQWYREWDELEEEKAPTVGEMAERRKAERRRDHEAPF